MRISVKIECEYCVDDLEIVSDQKSLKLPLNSEIRSEAGRLGWHIGRRCICPDCLRKLADSGKCAFCKYWRNKSMETPTCMLDGDLALSQDYCYSFEMKENRIEDETN